MILVTMASILVELRAWGTNPTTEVADRQLLLLRGSLKSSDCLSKKHSAHGSPAKVLAGSSQLDALAMTQGSKTQTLARNESSPEASSPKTLQLPEHKSASSSAPNPLSNGL